MKSLPGFIFSLFLILCITGCKKENPGNDESLYAVSGSIIQNGQPVSGVKVVIDDLEQFKTISDDNGNFNIKRVSPGLHDLIMIKSLEDDVTINRTIPIDVNTNLILDDLILPDPVRIVSVELDSINNKLAIGWTKSDVSDFREYKLYGHTSSGLDETTGELLHVATLIDDTTFVYQMPSSETRYFRVFVMNEYGKLGGSNIEFVSSGNINLISTGDFEEWDQFNQDWELTGEISFTDSIVYRGFRSLFMFSDITPSNWWSNACELHTFVIPADRKTYEVSFSFRLSGLCAGMAALDIIIEQDNEQIMDRNMWSPSWNFTPVGNQGLVDLEDTGWIKFSTTFSTISANPLKVKFTTFTKYAFIDDLSLKLKVVN